MTGYDSSTNPQKDINNSDECKSSLNTEIVETKNALMGKIRSISRNQSPAPGLVSWFYQT